MYFSNFSIQNMYFAFVQTHINIEEYPKRFFIKLFINLGLFSYLWIKKQFYVYHFNNCIKSSYYLPNNDFSFYSIWHNLESSFHLFISPPWSRYHSIPFSSLLFVNQSNRTFSGVLRAGGPARGWQAIDLMLFLDQCLPGTCKDLLQPTYLGSLGKINSPANKRDLLSKINHLKWQGSKRFFFSSPSSKMHCSSSIKHIFYLGRLRAAEEPLRLRRDDTQNSHFLLRAEYSVKQGGHKKEKGRSREVSRILSFMAMISFLIWDFIFSKLD